MQKWNNEMRSPRQAEDDKVIWPSLKGYWGALKRQGLIAALICIPVIALVVFAVSRWKEDYESTATILFDISKLRSSEQESSLVLANRIASTFSSRFSDPDFLVALHQRMVGKGLSESAISQSKLKEMLGEWIPAPFQPSSWKLDDAERERRARIDLLTNSMDVVTVPGQFVLRVTAHAANPGDAQTMAREAIQFFVEEDLARVKENLESQLKQLASLEASTLREKSNPQDLAATTPISEEPLDELGRKTLKTKEQALVTQVISKQRELARAQAIQYDREFALNNELNALLSKRGASHPEVIQKRREIEKFKTDGGVIQIDAELQRMKADLGRLQLTMKAQKIPIDRSVQISGFSEEVRRYLLDLSNQIRSVELEIDSIDQQQRDPKRWVRYQLVREAEYPNKAANVDKLYLLVAIGAVLVILTFLLVVLVRELWSPWIADREVFSRQYKIPVLLDAPRSRSLPFLGTTEIRNLRAQLGESSRKKELRILDSYRYLQELLRAKGNPQVISFFDLGQDKSSSSAAANLANVMATDSNDRVILLSFHPEGQKHLPKKANRDLMEFLAGECEWKDCRIKADGEMACDVALATRPELQLGHFREDLVQRLIKALRDKYQRIVIDGLNPMFVNENGMLGRESDVILIRMKLGATRKSDFDRILAVTHEDKVQGAVFT